MSEWKEKTLTDLCTDISYGYTESASVEKIGPKFLRITDIANGRLEWENVPYCPISADNYEKYKLEPGDIVIARTGATTGANYTFKESDPKDVVFASYLIRYRINPKIAYSFYLGHILRSTNWFDYVDAIAGGSAQPGANAKQLGSFEILLPPMKIQRAIASILSSLDDKIDLLHRQNQTLEKMAETLFRQWFVEEAKEEWEEKTLGDFISVRHGFAFKGKHISSELTNRILVTPGNIKIGGGFKSDKFKYYTNDNFPKDYIFEAGDLIVTMTDLSVDGDTLGYPALVPDTYKSEILLHNQRIGKILYKQNLSKFFLYYLMKTEDYQWFILSGASGTSIRHTSPKSICSYSFKLPPHGKLKDFNKLCEDMQDKIRINQIQIRTLTALRDTLLPKLMSGKVSLELFRNS